MRVAMDLANLRGFGGSFVGQRVYREFLRLGGADAVRAWIPAEWSGLGVEASGPVETVRGGPLARLWAENVSLRRAVRRWPADAVFSLGDTGMPRCPVPHLLLVQMPYLAYGPDERDFAMSRGFALQVRLIERYFALGLPTVAAVTVQTEHMRRRIVRRWGLAPERVLVVPSAIEEAPARAAAGYAPQGGYVFCPATEAAHKNHEVLPAMVSALARAGSRLRCAVTVEPRHVPALVAAARRLGVEGAFDFLGYVPRGRVRPLMEGAVAVVLPAKLETFGLPYFEAMNAGVPVIAADRECAREACAGAALYAAADSGRGFADHVLRLVADPGARAALAEAGRRRYGEVRRTWAEVARGYWDALQRLTGAGLSRRGAVG